MKFPRLSTSPKADLMVSFTYFIIIGLFISFMFLSIGKAFATNTINAKERHALELALLLESASATRNNFYVQYPYDISPYSIKITPHEVIVYEDSINEPTAAKKDFVNANQYFHEEFIQPKQLFIARQGNKILISQEQPNIGQFTCNDVVTKNIDWPNQKIYLETDPALFALLSEPSSIDFSKIFDATYHTATPYLFLLGIRNNEQPEQHITIYYSIQGPHYQESEKLGCSLANELITALPEHPYPLSLIPTTPDSMTDAAIASTLATYQESGAPFLVISLNIPQQDTLAFKQSLEKSFVRYYS